uniref:Secreted peptide n=1 Tax=Anopheles braziliensis TaxID=58242 RepID=A0A2M3ZLH9_9DIPT
MGRSVSLPLSLTAALLVSSTVDSLSTSVTDFRWPLSMSATMLKFPSTKSCANRYEQLPGNVKCLSSNVKKCPPSASCPCALNSGTRPNGLSAYRRS